MPIAMEDSNLVLLKETASAMLVTVQNSHERASGTRVVDSGESGKNEFKVPTAAHMEREPPVLCVLSLTPWGSSLRTVPGAPGRAAPSVAPHGRSAPTTQRKTRARPLSDRLALVFRPYQACVHKQC